MAIPVYQEAATGQTGGATTVDVDCTGLTISADDLLIGLLVTDGKDETHTSPESDAWNDIQVNITEGTNMTASCWWKIADGTEDGGNLTFGCGSSEAMRAWVLRITNHNVSAPIDSNSNSASGDSGGAICPGITTQYDNELLLYFIGADHTDGNNGDSWSDTGRATTHIDAQGSDGGNGSCSGAYGTQELAGNGATGAETYTLAGTEEWAAFTIGIRELVAGTDHTKGLSDTVTISDTPAKSMGVVKSDSLSINETRASSAGVAKSDTVTVTEAIDNVSTFSRDLSDAMAIIDSPSKVSGIVKSDTVNITDAQSKATGIAKADTIVVADSLASEATYERSLSDTVGITDSPSKGLGIEKADTVNITDSPSKASGIVKEDTITIADLISKGPGIAKTDSMAIADTIGKLSGLGKSDNVVIGDSLATESAFILGLTDSMAVADDFDYDHSGAAPPVHGGKKKGHIAAQMMSGGMM